MGQDVDFANGEKTWQSGKDVRLTEDDPKDLAYCGHSCLNT